MNGWKISKCSFMRPMWYEQEEILIWSIEDIMSRATGKTVLASVTSRSNTCYVYIIKFTSYWRFILYCRKTNQNCWVLFSVLCDDVGSQLNNPFYEWIRMSCHFQHMTKYEHKSAGSQASLRRKPCSNVKQIQRQWMYCKEFNTAAAVKYGRRWSWGCIQIMTFTNKNCC